MEPKMDEQLYPEYQEDYKMTKKELLERLQNIPDDSIIDIYDLRTFTHPSYEINTESYFDYDNGRPIVTIEIV